MSKNATALCPYHHCAMASTAPVYTEYYNGGVHFISADAPPKGSDWYDVASDGKSGAVAIGTLTGVTKDGGNTWGQLGYSFSRKAAITYGDGVYIVLNAGTVYRSADGGYTWTRTNLGSEWVGADSYCAAYGDGACRLKLAGVGTLGQRLNGHRRK